MARILFEVVRLWPGNIHNKLFPFCMSPVFCRALSEAEPRGLGG